MEVNMIISIWDRTSPINGISAEWVLENREDIKREPNVLLFSNPETLHIDWIEFPPTLITIMNTHQDFSPVDETKTPIEIGHLWLQYLYIINNPVTPPEEGQPNV